MSDLIDRQEAIKAVCESGDAFDMIERLNSLPSAEPESKERPLTEDDYAYCAECDHVEMCRWYPMYGCEFKSRPSAQPERKTGRWEISKDDSEIFPFAKYTCSSCGCSYFAPYRVNEIHYFCFNCGTDMRGEKE